MGEIAEMFLEGTLCQVCGEFMGDIGDGFPVTCAGCEKSERASGPRETRNRIRCNICDRWVKKKGLEQHTRDKHGAAK